MLAGLLLVVWMMTTAFAEAAANEWVWIASDTKYGKYYAPSHIKVESSVNGVATQLSAWTKTVYSYEGAQETIANYGIAASIPDPRQLAYSTALLVVRPQTREIEYVQENFYDPDNKVIWSKVYDPRTVKEINSQSFDSICLCAHLCSTCWCWSLAHHGRFDFNSWTFGNLFELCAAVYQAF